MNLLRIAIDGTASAGKGSIAREVARRLDIAYIDTGAMYRSIALLCLENNIDWTNIEAITRLTEQSQFEFFWDNNALSLRLNGRDVSKLIRKEEIGSAASIVSAIPGVRSELAQRQKQYALGDSLVMDGRDIGTVVIPDAELKVFVDADLQERAKRRWKEEQAKGLNTIYDDVLTDLAERDHRDRSRDISPLLQAVDAKLLDTTKRTIEEGVQQILDWVKELQ